MSRSFVYRSNHLLDVLAGAERLRLYPKLQAFEMPVGFVVYDAERPQSHVYFPIDALVSLQHVMTNGSASETAVVGNEGMVGVSVFMGGHSTLGRAVVKCAGRGLRLTAQCIKNEFNRGGPVMHLLLRYTQALLTQIAQTAACNRHHSIDAQVCRWLLLSLDHIQGNELSMTHERIAEILGVRREGVTESAGRLQKAGVIHYGRGRILVVDRGGLEKRTCECYAVVKKEYARLLPKGRIKSSFAQVRTWDPLQECVAVPA
jgi:CRP-like cAMP-binding protein